MMENHLHDNVITFTLRFSRSLATIFAIGDGRKIFETLPVLKGPADNYIGGSWDFSPFLLNQEEPLPFNNQPILYASGTCPEPKPQDDGKGTTSTNMIACPNPRPSGDLRSRGTLVSLVFSALSNPGTTDLMQMPLSPNPANDNSYAGGP
jgi:hypothetical protein